MLIGKVTYRCDKDFTTIEIPAKCIETFCRGSAFPLNKASGSVSTSIKEETITLVETSGAEQATQGKALLGPIPGMKTISKSFCRCAFVRGFLRQRYPRANLESRSSTMRFSLARYERQLVSS